MKPSLVAYALLTLITALGLPTIVPAADSAPASFQVGEFKFKRPEKWTWVEPTSAMRKAHLKVAGAEGAEGAEAIFYYFGEGSGGGTSANVDRWLGQFQEAREKIGAKVEETKIQGRKVTFVQAQGTFLSGMPGGPKKPQPGTMLKGAILESDQGSVFIKMTGPQELVAKSDPEFRKLVESAYAK